MICKIKKKPLTHSLFTVVLFFFSTLCSTAQARELSLNLKNVSIKEAISQIENSSDYVFVYSGNVDKEINQKKNIKVEKASIETVLQKLLNNSSLDYKLLDRQVVVFKKNKKQSNGMAAVLSKRTQEAFPVKGTIVDKEGVPISGATVVVKGNKKT